MCLYTWVVFISYVCYTCLFSTFPVAHANLGALLTTASKGRPQHACTSHCAPLSAVPLWFRFLCNEFYELIRVMWSGKWVRSTACVQSSTFLSLHTPHIVIHRVWCLLLRTSSFSFTCHVTSCHISSHHSIMYIGFCVLQAVVTPGSLLNTLWQKVPSFHGYSQQDAQEFLWCGLHTCCRSLLN